METENPLQKPTSLPHNPHLPATSLLDGLRRRGLDHPAPDRIAPVAGGPVAAVVFAPLVLPSWDAGLEQAKMLFIKRSAGMRRHAGQVGFPGGVVDEQDASLLDAGHREAEEEIALVRSTTEVLCPLPTAEVPSGFQLYPYFVATDQQTFVAQPSEVESIHLVSVQELLTCPVRLEHKEWKSKVYRVIYFDLEELCVWGVTGRIVEHLLQNFFDWRSEEIA